MTRHVWATGDRLDAAPLNDNFRQLFDRTQPLRGLIAELNTPAVVVAETILPINNVVAGNSPSILSANALYAEPAGLWMLSAHVTVANVATGERHICRVKRNGVIVGEEYRVPGATGTVNSFLITIPLLMAFDDYVQLFGVSSVSADWQIVRATWYLLSAGGVL